ncbi:PLD nuclease N-terminal domain-containing protein [Rummeliibacillus stabekisii]|uniref:PLD nuclease N-terminal domain-containing protein n=1 Tax=Rummeliibacillus stabekisii TaxID=241244 RepID=UPI00116EB65B|nr:PLD nuclease N-terminal domain-containing protein [Rummeliibacillus stabekisii]MBB5171191.1 putative ABC-type exoprotein transport system permease subunit [Rummeliibacillus stabekisii]GEL06104.1 negative regulatory protein YxlE [Rummeliibacillus stabekisii]
MIDINWALVAPLLVIQFILFIVALIDLIRIHETNGPKWVWAIVIIFLNTIGPICYFIFGRKTS